MRWAENYLVYVVSQLDIVKESGPELMGVISKIYGVVNRW
jgi:hypothetical protein